MTRKLSLNRETIRNLNRQQLGRAVGGTGSASYNGGCSQPNDSFCECTVVPSMECVPTQLEYTCIETLCVTYDPTKTKG